MSARFRRCFAILLLVLSGTVAAPTAFAETTYSFNLPEQALADSLRAIGQQTEMNILFEPDAVKNARSPALRGQYTVDEAIRLVLIGTKLEAQHTAASNVVIKVKSTRSTALPATTADPPANSGTRLAQSNSGQSGASAGPQNIDTLNSEPSKREDLEEIIVTGTHIHNVVPISPVLSITHDDIVRQGYTTIAEVIEQLPQNFLGGASPAANPISNFGGTLATYNQTFASSINLRGLGPNATLVLLNGRRMAPAAFAGVADISNIPVNMIDRIEILTDGASSVYGADAVAGVVNIITRQEFSAVQVGGGLTGISEGKTPDHDANVLTGLSWSGGGLVASADYEKDNPLYARNRYFTSGLADPWELSPKNEKMNLYLSAHQDVSDALTLSGDGFVTRRNFEAVANQYAQYGIVGPPVTHQGRANQYSASLQLDYRISPDWTAALIGQVSREQDRTFFFAPVSDSGAANPGSYRVASLESRIDGKLFDAPGGAVRTAIGAQFLQEHFEEVDSAGTVSDPTAYGPYQEFNDSRHVLSAYGELSIPLIGKDNAVLMAKGLRINVSGRYDKYSDFGHTSNPRFALEWEPAADVKIHATYSRSFQVPTFQELSNPRAAFVEPLPDPKSATGSTLGVVTTGGSPNLKPETAKSLNFGVTYEPRSVMGLKIEASYFSVKFDNQIIQINDLGFNTNSFLPQEAILGPSLVERNPSLEDITQALAVPQVYNYIAANPCLIGSPGCPAVDPASVKAIVNGAYVNSASSTVAGEDVDVRYKIPETRFGNFLVDLDASYFNKYEFKLSSTAPGTSFINTTLNPLRFRAKANFGWSHSAWGANARVNFSNKYNNTFDTNCAATNSCSVSSWTTIDLNLSFAPLTGMGPRWLEDSRVALLVANIFNRAPPSVTGLLPNQGYDPLNANPLLRTFGVTFTKRFGGNGDR
jgi:iron complex outermembrane receptor protein